MKLPTQPSARIQPPTSSISADEDTVRARSLGAPASSLDSAVGDPRGSSAGSKEAWGGFVGGSTTTGRLLAAPGPMDERPAGALSWVEAHTRSAAPSLEETAREVLRILDSIGVTLDQVARPAESETAHRAQQQILSMLETSPLRGQANALPTALRLAHALLLIPGAHARGVDFLAEARARGLVALNGMHAYPETWSGTVGVLLEGQPPVFGAFVPPDRPFSATFGVRTEAGVVTCRLDDVVGFAVGPRAVMGQEPRAGSIGGERG